MKSFKFTSILILIGFVFLITSNGQQKDRLISSRPDKMWEPLRIVQMKIKDKPVNFGEYTVEDDDWLKGFSVEVENTTELPIYYFEIELNFLKVPNKMNGSATYDLRYGFFPVLPGMSPRVNPSQPPLLPGERATLVVNYENLQGLLDYANGGSKSSIVEVIVKVGRAVFSHDIMWKGGAIFKRDEKNPGKWVTVDLNR